MVRFVEGGLKDLSISRATISWGIPWPGDREHVVYVWLDALTNYVSALGFGSGDAALYERYWPAALHLVGKDILRFHCVYWPAFLMSAGLPLPRQVFGHGWWLRDERKMSKSLGNVVRPDALLERFGPDALRYFMLREMTFGADASFSDEGFLARYNADLANGLGNAASRVLAMARRYGDGRTPSRGVRRQRAAHQGRGGRRALARDDGRVRVPPRPRGGVGAARGRGRLRQREGAVGDREDGRGVVAAAAARPLQLPRVAAPGGGDGVARDARGERAPARAARRGRRRAVRSSGVVSGPGSRSGRKARCSRAPTSRRSFRRSRWTKPNPCNRHLRLRPRPARRLPAPAPAAPAAAAAAEPIGIDEFARVKLVVGTVKAAERVPKSKKLIRLEVDLGEPAPRQIVGGIGDRYQPEQLVGRQIVVVANLKPAVLMGVESRGMLLAASLDGAPFLLGPDGEVPPGTGVKWRRGGGR